MPKILFNIIFFSYRESKSECEFFKSESGISKNQQYSWILFDTFLNASI